MRGSALAAAFLGLTVLGCAFQPGATSTRITGADLHARARRIASPRAEGRAPGSEGARSVATWIRREFERLDLVPVDIDLDGTPRHVHRLRAPGAALADSGRNRLTIRRGAEETVIEAGRDWMPFSIDEPRCFRTGVGEVVLVGLGHDEGAGAWNDYTADVKDRVALVFRGIPPGTEAKYKDGSGFKAKYEAARKHGAKALLICNDPAWSRRHGDPVGFAGFDIEAVDDLPCAYVSQRLARKILGCSGADLARLARTAQQRQDLRVIDRTYVELSIDVKVDDSLTNTENILGMVPGTSQGPAKGVLVVGAHHDHIGRAFDWFSSRHSRGGHDDRGAVHPGADDNASGVAVMLELAEWFSSPENRLPCPIVFVAFGSEEYDQRGSDALSKTKFFKQNALLVLNLDMVGRQPNGSIQVHGTSTWSGLEAVIRHATAASGSRWPICTQITERDHDPVPLEKYRPIPSDHLSFERGPYLAITTGIHHDDYHGPRDIAERLDPRVMRYVADVCRGVVRDLGSFHVEALREVQIQQSYLSYFPEFCLPLCRSCRDLTGPCPGTDCDGWEAALERAVKALKTQDIVSLDAVINVDGTDVEASGEPVRALLVDAVRNGGSFEVVVVIEGNKTALVLTP